jgi:hypothetical protein
MDKTVDVTIPVEADVAAAFYGQEPGLTRSPGQSPR